MQRVGQFEKVSYEQFQKAIWHPNMILPSGEWTEDRVKQIYDEIKLPVRATSGAAGYDFFAPYDFSLYPGQSIRVPTGIRVKIDPGWWLACMPRSSLGCKYRIQLDNTIGVVDSDYYGSDNEGHLFMQITNDSKAQPFSMPNFDVILHNKVLVVEAGTRFFQSIFLPYGITYDDHADKVRNGGFGSTGK